MSDATAADSAFWSKAAVAERRHVGRRVKEILKIIQGHPALTPWEREFATSIAAICTKTHGQPSLSDKQLALLLRLHDLVTGQFTMAADREVEVEADATAD